MRYRAFFSYSRDDDRVADWLHARLDGYRVPPLLLGQSGAHGAIPAKLHPIFRDRTDMPGGDVLGDRITAALAESESLIVLCSRSAAASRWVAQECDVFIASGRARHIYPVIAPNLPQSADVESDFFPPPLRGRGLLAADLREIKLPTDKVIGDGRRIGVLKLIAGLLGVDLDDLVEREARRARKRFLNAVGLAGTSVIALVAAGGLVVNLTWRPALNANGWLELRQGPKQLSIYNMIGLGPRVELPIDANALDKLNGKLEQVRDEANMGFWPSRRDGIRTWGFEIADLLEPDARRAWLVRIGALSEEDLLSRGLAGLPVPFGPDASLRETERAVLAQSQSVAPVLWQREWRFPPVAPCGIGGPPEYAEYIQLLLDESEDVTLRRLRGLTAVASLSSEINGDVLIRLLTLYGHVNETWRSAYTSWIGDPTEPLNAARVALRFKERPTLAEARALADITRTLRRRSASLGVPPLTEPQRHWLRDSLNRCGGWTSPVLASIAEADDIVRLRAWTRTRIQADQGRIALQQLAADAKLQPQDIRFVLDTYGFGRDPQGTYVALVSAGEWLRAIAALQGLPPNLADELLAFAKREIDIKQLDRADRALVILALAMRKLGESRNHDFTVLLERRFAASSSPIRPASEFELAGLAELNGTNVAVLRARWEDVRSHEPPSIAPKNRLGSGTSLEEAMALARLVAGAIASGDQTVARPESGWFESTYADALDAGFDPKNLCALAEAEARARPTFSADAYRAMLMRNRPNAHARLAAVHVHAARIASAAAPDAEIQAVRALYATEIEPDIKHDLADLLLLTSPIGTPCLPRP
ncbi:MAG: toll/interleukin-1 receptor domain-containing protein [Nitrospira sp.]